MTNHPSLTPSRSAGEGGVQSIPEGWQLVPKEPTPQMVRNLCITNLSHPDAATIKLGREVAKLLLMEGVEPLGRHVDEMAYWCGTMIAGYRAMLKAAPLASPTAPLTPASPPRKGDGE